MKALSSINIFKMPLIITSGFLIIAATLTASVDSFNWQIVDFAIMALMLLIATIGYQLLTIKFTLNKLLPGALVTLLFLLIWVQLAVGLI